MTSTNLRVPPVQPETAHLSCPVTFGLHLYRTEGEDPSIAYVDDERGIHRMVVDRNGQFCDFPVVITEDFWIHSLQDPSALKNQIRFRTSFEKVNGGFMVLWNIQPDGRYWADAHGFGGTSDIEITLYSFLDTEGKICVPFRIYRLGNQIYYTPQSQPVPQSADVAEVKESPILQADKKNSLFFREFMSIVTFLGNAVILLIIAVMSDGYTSYYGKYDRYDSVFEYMMDDTLWIFLIVLAIFNLVSIALAVIPHWLIQKSGLTLTDSRCFGISTAGKQFDLTAGEITSVSHKKATLTVGAGKQKYTLRFLRNATQLHTALTEFSTGNAPQSQNHLLPQEPTVQPEIKNKSVQLSSPPVSSKTPQTRKAPKPQKDTKASKSSAATERSLEDVLLQLEKLKKLLDDGALTKEEYEQLKSKLIP